MVPTPVPGMWPPLQPGSPTAPSWHPQVASQPPSPGTTTSQVTANGLGFDATGIPVDPWRGATTAEASGTHPSATAATGASPEAASAAGPRQPAGASYVPPPVAPPVQAPMFAAPASSPVLGSQVPWPGTTAGAPSQFHEAYQAPFIGAGAADAEKTVTGITAQAVLEHTRRNIAARIAGRQSGQMGQALYGITQRDGRVDCPSWDGKDPGKTLRS